MPQTIRVGLTLAHGMAHEVSLNPGEGVRYSFIRPHSPSRLIRSPIKGFMGHYRADGQDLIEAVMSPVFTRDRWVLSCENLEAVTAFGFLGCPLPRRARVAFIRSLLLKDNCKRVIFWSAAGRSTLTSYGCVPEDDPLWQKTEVIYPAVRTVADDLVRPPRPVRAFLFSGDFFRKGGVNVVDAFERLRRDHPDVTLTICCDPSHDFNTPDEDLRREYLSKIAKADGITVRGRVPRAELLQTVLPAMDVYLLPTYVETFGVSIIEAMAYGMPVVATNHFAIPEMLEHEVSGLLIDTSGFDTVRMFRGYVVRHIPPDFRQHVTDQLFGYLRALVETPGLGERLGSAALQTARTKFSFAARNRSMQRVYQEALV
jgi:glycosyltransferase involved in cell wall biosynthesis